MQFKGIEIPDDVALVVAAIVVLAVFFLFQNNDDSNGKKKRKGKIALDANEYQPFKLIDIKRHFYYPSILDSLLRLGSFQLEEITQYPKYQDLHKQI